MIEVACAIIVNPDNQVLVAQRSAAMKMPLKMEFPGGKVEPGENAAGCLIREIKEELNLLVCPVFEMEANIHRYPDFTIKLIPFICTITSGELVLKEHIACYWADLEMLYGLDWAEADILIMKNYLAGNYWRKKVNLH